MNPLVAHQPQSHRKQSSTCPHSNMNQDLQVNIGERSLNTNKGSQHLFSYPTLKSTTKAPTEEAIQHPLLQNKSSLVPSMWYDQADLLHFLLHQTIVTLLKDLKHEQLMIVCCVEDIPLSIPLELERRWTPSSLTKQIPAWPGKNLLHSSFCVGFGYLKGRDKMQVQVASIR
jgi:hypothetical protein